MIDKLIETSLPAVATAYEQRIEKMEIEKTVLEEKIENSGTVAPDFDKLLEPPLLPSHSGF